MNKLCILLLTFYKVNQNYESKFQNDDLNRDVV